MARKKRKQLRKELFLDQPTSHGGWPNGGNNSWIGNKPVKDIIYNYIEDMGLADDVPHARLSESLDMNMFSNSNVLISKASQLHKEMIDNMTIIIQGFKKWEKSWFISPKLNPQEEKAIKLYWKCIFFIEGSLALCSYYQNIYQQSDGFLGPSYTYFKENMPDEIEYANNMFNIMNLVANNEFVSLQRFIKGWFRTSDKFYDYIMKYGEKFFGSDVYHSIKSFQNWVDNSDDSYLNINVRIAKNWIHPNNIFKLKELTVNMHHRLLENNFKLYSKRKIKALVTESIRRHLNV